MTRRVVVGKGRAKVILEGALAGEIEDAMVDSLGPIAEELKARADALREHARERWPVKTGRSRASLRSQIVIDPHRPGAYASVTSDAGYSRFIKWGRYAIKENTRGYRVFYDSIPEWAAKQGFTLVRTQPFGAGRTAYVMATPSQPVPWATTEGRGGVILDLLRRPADASRREFRVRLPELVLGLLRERGVIDG